MRGTDHQGVIVRARIARRIGDDQRFLLEGGVTAQRPVARRFLEVQSEGRFEPLTLGIKEADQCDRSIAKGGR